MKCLCLGNAFYLGKFPNDNCLSIQGHFIIETKEAQHCQLLMVSESLAIFVFYCLCTIKVHSQWPFLHKRILDLIIKYKTSPFTLFFFFFFFFSLICNHQVLFSKEIFRLYIKLLKFKVVVISLFRWVYSPVLLQSTCSNIVLIVTGLWDEEGSLLFPSFRWMYSLLVKRLYCICIYQSLCMSTMWHKVNFLSEVSQIWIQFSFLCSGCHINTKEQVYPTIYP